LSKDRTVTLLTDRIPETELDPDFRKLIDCPGVDYLCLDLMNREAVSALPKDVDTIYHLAAIIGVEQVQHAPARVLEVNALTTLNVFNYARTLANLRRVLFSSTSEVYAGTLKHFDTTVPTGENAPLCLEDVSAPRASYALSKIYGEGVAFAWRHNYGIPITIIRYHNIYGPRMGFRHVIPQTFVKIAESDGKVEVPSPDHTRAFCYIDDAVEATIRCGGSANTEGKTVHVGSSAEEIAIRELVLRIADIMDRSISILDMPATPGSPARRCPDTSVLERLTGFRAQVPLKEGLRLTYEWYRDRLPLRAASPRQAQTGPS
jgi:nucleoside-diphosphate-sugar epimerase